MLDSTGDADERFDRPMVVIGGCEWRRRRLLAGLSEFGGVLAPVGSFPVLDDAAVHVCADADVVLLTGVGSSGDWDRFAWIDDVRSLRSQLPGRTD
jgi:hypothetical protein